MKSLYVFIPLPDEDGEGWGKVEFDADQIPQPKKFYESELLEFEQGDDDWAFACCPVHGDSERNFTVNIVTGQFGCFGCGFTGADLLEFVQVRDECDAVTAMAFLEEWSCCHDK